MEARPRERERERERKEEIYLFKESVGVFGVLGSAVSDPLSEPLLRRFRDAPRANFTEKTRGFCKVSLLVSGLIFSNFGAQI